MLKEAIDRLIDAGENQADRIVAAESEPAHVERAAMGRS